MNEKVTMQCEEVEAPSETPAEMTFSDSKDSSSPKYSAEAQIFDESNLQSTKFDEINLEDDIEKVEVSSPESSETNEDEDRVLLPQQNPESIQSWLQKITDLQKKLALEPQVSSFPIKNQTPNKVMKFQDLPYMGEMTLDNSKPRRGRKPKKADICHLIYKNYGTIFPGTPNPQNYKKTDTKEVQNRIISSLLEKRLTQEKKAPSQSQNEPLNLCIRDLNHLKIRLSEIKSETPSDDDVEFVQETLPSKEGEAPGGYVYWPNAGIFIHPMALQQQLLHYQRLNNSYTLPKAEDKLQPKAKEQEPKVKRNATTSSDKTPTKRKRSAIFIPPIPTENNTNPATEVSICKFKFTGGAKPSLQEKKMLSVDSGGNFRYYSGTGDKSMRGYEFFPRETLQQQVNNSQGSSTGAFLQASGEKIYPGSPVDFTGSKPNQEFMLAPDLPPPEHSRHKKRKSRKSLQREKLEQTFKEKGFLIQTQQLESAEGATYCKFRQLRKFTRYLFRSWKDYLPGNVRELQEGEREGDEARQSSEVQL